MHWVYIIYSPSTDIYYKGYSHDPFARLDAHNNDETRYTARKGPWQIVFLQSFSSKKVALQRERRLKKYSKEQIQQLIKSKLNEVG